MDGKINRFWCLYITLLIRLLEIHFAKCETIIANPNHNSVIEDIEQASNKPYDKPSADDLNIFVDRITKLESLIFTRQAELESYQDQVRDEIKTIRNATLLLLSLVSGRGTDCQGLKDTASKVKILYSALAAYEPSLNFGRFEQEIHPVTEQLSTTTTTETSTTANLDLSNSGLESRDLVLHSFSTISTTATRTDGTFKHPSHSTTTSTTIPTTEIRTQPTIITTRLTPTRTYHKIKRPTRQPILCPRGSKLVGRECFSVHLDIRLNWTSARSFCRRRGGDLAEPNLSNDKLPRQLQKTWSAFRESSYWTLWVGATDQEVEGQWHWVTGGPLNLKGSPRWDVGEADEEGEAQDCLAMILWVPGRWQRWDLLDDPCDLEWFLFCEYSP